MKHEDVHWVRNDLELENGQSLKVQARIRYRQALSSALLCRKDRGYFLLFDTAQRGITPGQFAAWYIEDELIGSGVIS